MEISSYGRQGSRGNFAYVSGHRQCLLFLSFDTPGGCVGSCRSCLLAVMFSAWLSIFALTYIIIFVNFRKKGKDMAGLSVRKHTDRYVGKGKEQTMSNILLLEDDLSLINGLSFALRKQGYELEVARTIKEVDIVWAEGKYDLLILDVSLPDGSGFEICEKVRQTSKVPIIFLTASDEEVNIIMGLDMGGDDYITKPFKLGVLLSRINALLRRAGDFGQTDTEIVSNGLKALLTQGKVYKNGELLDLTAGEYKLLCLFMNNPGTVLSKEQILENLWDNEGNYIDNNTLNVYIRRLRTKIEDNPSDPQMILTVRRMGYKWNII